MKNTFRRAWHMSKGMVGEFLHHLPYTSKQFGPPRSFLPRAEEALFPKNTFKYEQIYLEQVISLQEASALGRQTKLSTFSRTEHEVPLSSIYQFLSGRYYQGYGQAILTAEDYLVDSVSLDSLGLYQPHSIFLDLLLPRVKKYDGTVAVLNTPYSSNYCHWLLDCLPRLLLLKYHFPGFQEINTFVFESIHQRFHKDMLNLLGLDLSKVLVPEGRFHLEAEHLVTTSFVQGTFHNQPWALQLLRRAFLAENNSSSFVRFRRLFISRQNAVGGRIVNYSDFLEVLKLFQFEVLELENMSFSEQVAAMNEAQVVLAPHGAGLSNLVFSNPGTTLIELFAPQYMPPFFWELSSHLGINYLYFLGEGSLPEDTDYACRRADNIEINLKTFVPALGQFLATCPVDE